MGDLLSTAGDWLEGQRKSHLSGQVAYCRGEEEIAVAATVGRSAFTVERGHGIYERVESRDYLIAAADLIIDGQQTEPQRGDQIKETHGEQTLTYEVLAPGDMPPWRYSDPYRRTLRIHTKHVAAD